MLEAAAAIMLTGVMVAWAAAYARYRVERDRRFEDELQSW